MPNLYFTILLIVAATGGAVAFVGWLFTVLTALGNKNYVMGALCFVFFPFAWYYSAVNWHKDHYAGKLLFSGTAVVLVCALISWVLYAQLEMQIIPA